VIIAKVAKIAIRFMLVGINDAVRRNAKLNRRDHRRSGSAGDSVKENSPCTAFQNRLNPNRYKCSLCDLDPLDEAFIHLIFAAMGKGNGVGNKLGGVHSPTFDEIVSYGSSRYSQ
jgi:hypothetical protein